MSSGKPIIIPTKRIAESHPFLAGVSSKSHSTELSYREVKLFIGHLLRAEGRRCRGSQQHHWHLPSRR